MINMIFVKEELLTSEEQQHLETDDEPNEVVKR
jgi:hypothetical protein